MSRILLLALALLLMTDAADRRDGLHLEIVGTGGPVWHSVIQKHERFELSFVHSSERCRWTHRYYAADVGHIEQLDSTFTCFGAGMPVVTSDGSPLVRTRDGYVARAEADLGDLTLMAWRRGKITLAFRGNTVAFGPMFDDFERVTVRLR